jgi:hypothetical protein
MQKNKKTERKDVKNKHSERKWKKKKTKIKKCLKCGRKMNESDSNFVLRIICNGYLSLKLSGYMKKMLLHVNSLPWQLQVDQ